jgi:hypothetical protein
MEAAVDFSGSWITPGSQSVCLEWGSSSSRSRAILGARADVKTRMRKKSRRMTISSKGTTRTQMKGTCLVREQPVLAS